MLEQDKKEDSQKNISRGEGQIPTGDQALEFEKESAPVPERREIPKSENEVVDELRREIDVMNLDDNLKVEAEKKAKKIEFLGEKEKIEELLKIAREKGVVYAVQVARRMNEPYLLDVFHDVLAKEGYFKKIGMNKSDDDN